MNNVDDTIFINRLIDAYGSLLTPSQYHIVDLYYRFNLSISEIAEEKNISRSAVNDSLHKSVKMLEEYEDKINLLKQKDDFFKLLKTIDLENDLEKKHLIIEQFLKENDE